MFMSSLVFEIACGRFDRKRFCAGFLSFVFIYFAVGGFNYKEGGWDPIKRYIPTTLFCLSQYRTWISNIICFGLFLCSMI